MNARPTESFDASVLARLGEWRAAGLWRELRRLDSPQGRTIEAEGRTFLNFSSNDYLGLANHDALKQAAIEALGRFGAGAGASRLISGSLAPSHELEESLAAWKGTAAALAFSTGYTTALGAIPALVGKDDIVVIDKLVHASIVDAARLSGATLRVFRHNDLEDLERILAWGRKQPPGAGRRATAPPNILVVTESVFSMDGDLAPLRDIVELKEKHGAWLMVDEAHATGLFGSNRRGLAEEHDVSDRIEIQMGTLGKAIGAGGGYICGSRPLVDLLINRARSFIFSTAPMPAQAAAARAGVALIQSSEGRARCDRLWSLVDLLKNELTHGGRPPGPVRSPIVPVITGQERAAVDLAAALRERGILVPAIRYPTVARGAARLRVTLSAEHTPADIAALSAALSSSPGSQA